MFTSLRLIPRTATRSLHTTSIALSGAAPKGPTHTSRTSPGNASGQSTHPGYTRGDEPPSSKNPSEMSQPEAGSVPSSQARHGSTVTDAHKDVNTMAEGAKIGGSDAITPEERSTKVWGPNQRTPEFNEHEGKRRPVIDGGSNEGGKGPDGKSRTFSTSSKASASSSTPASPTNGGALPRRRRFPPIAGGGLTLEHFLMRGKVLSLYRSFLRATRNIPNPQARCETIDWLRGDFERKKNETDLEKLHDLLMGGHVALKKLHGPMELVSASATGGPAWGSFVPFRRGGDVTRG